MKNKIIVTRHSALIELLVERGIVDKDTPVVSHATPESVQDKDVIGVLPMHLASRAKSITEIPLELAPEDRGKELSLERLREIAGKPVTYTVKVGRPIARRSTMPKLNGIQETEEVIGEWMEIHDEKISEKQRRLEEYEPCWSMDEYFTYVESIRFHMMDTLWRLQDQWWSFRRLSKVPFETVWHLTKRRLKEREQARDRERKRLFDKELDFEIPW